MSTAALIDVDEYLSTSYDPDCDYVDGVLIERNAGQQSHSETQSELLAWFRARRQQTRLKEYPEWRIRASPTRFRVPDVCVAEMPVAREPVMTSVPYLCAEILSPDDRMPRVQEKVDDYLALGVPNVWVIDPESQRAWTVTHDGWLDSRGILRSHDGRVEIPVRDLFPAE